MGGGNHRGGSRTAGGAALQEDAGQFRRALPDLMDPARDNATVLDSLMHGPRRELEAQSQVSWRAMGPLVVPSALLWAQRPGLQGIAVD